MAWKSTGQANKISREELKGNRKKNNPLKQREQTLKEKRNITINIDELFINDGQDYMTYRRLKEYMERR